MAARQSARGRVRGYRLLPGFTHSYARVFCKYRFVIATCCFCAGSPCVRQKATRQVTPNVHGTRHTSLCRHVAYYVTPTGPILDVSAHSAGGAALLPTGAGVCATAHHSLLCASDAVRATIACQRVVAAPRGHTSTPSPNTHCLPRTTHTSLHFVGWGWCWLAVPVLWPPPARHSHVRVCACVRPPTLHSDTTPACPQTSKAPLRARAQGQVPAPCRLRLAGPRWRSHVVRGRRWGGRASPPPT